jgi:hypothetical protein
MTDYEDFTAAQLKRIEADGGKPYEQIRQDLLQAERSRRWALLFEELAEDFDEDEELLL